MRKKLFRRSLTLLLAVVMTMGSVLTASAASTFTIRYCPDSYTKETASYTQSQTLGVVAKLKSAVYTRTGYTQTAWGIGTSDDTSIMNAKNVTLLDLGGTVVTAAYYLSHNTTRMYLYPYWTANTYYVKYVDPVSGKSAKVTYTYDKSYSYPSASMFTRSGYTLKGWSTISGNSTSTTTYPTGSVSQTGSRLKNLTSTNRKTITLYAVWQKK